MKNYDEDYDESDDWTDDDWAEYRAELEEERKEREWEERMTIAYECKCGAFNKKTGSKVGDCCCGAE